MKKMRPAETIPGMGEGRVKENDGRGTSTTIYFKNFCKCQNASPVQQYNLKNVKKRKNLESNQDTISNL
jgi:hypothetical protein